jgi:hypothetical protein
MSTLAFVIFGIIIVPLLILAIFLLKGKGGFLIAGFNTMSKEDQAKYDEKALCRFVGWLLIVVLCCVVLIPISIQFECVWLMYGGIVLTFVIISGAVIFMNTGNRFHKNGHSDLYTISKNDHSDLSSESKGKKSKSTATIAVIIASSAFSVIIVIAVGIMLFYGAKEPVVNVSDQGIQIKTLYGLNVNFSDISDISLIEKSMGDIGVGRRTNGYGGVGDTLKGNFESDNLGETLLFVQSKSSPTIRIECDSRKDIYVSFRDSEATRALYDEMIREFSLK